MTVSITWITPLLAAISAVVTCALSTITRRSSTGWRCFRLQRSSAESSLTSSWDITLPGNTMIREKSSATWPCSPAGAGFPPFRRATWQGLVRWGRHREGTGPFQRCPPGRRLSPRRLASGSVRQRLPCPRCRPRERPKSEPAPVRWPGNTGKRNLIFSSPLFLFPMAGLPRRYACAPAVPRASAVESTSSSKPGTARRSPPSHTPRR